ncbi:MAG: glycoside hydrolase family 78 protein [Phycisphaerales bacterium]|nr:glycoside hydrolase family 78 protein [Phycisphaerales bacterium]
MPHLHSIVILGFCASLASADLRIVNPRCEYGSDPVGIDVARPRLSWVLESDARGTQQAAYRIMVASAPEKLTEGSADLWDSGAVRSDQSIHVEYGGKALAARQRAYWRVQVWSNRDETASGPVGMWEMGLTEGGPTGKWIWLAPVDGRQPSPLVGAKWIWFPEGDPVKSAPQAERFFRRDIAVPQGDAITSAEVQMTADDQFELFINGKSAGGSDGQQDAWRRMRTLDVSGLLQPGNNALAIKCRNDKDAAGLLLGGRIALASGKVIEIKSDGGWNTSQKIADGWMTAPTDGTWGAAKEIAALDKGPWGRISPEPPLGLSPYMRKEIALDKPIKSARLYATALGVYEFHINGQRIGNDVFNPGWTDFNQRIQYHTYDVTKALRQGKNALGVIVGDGWYAGHVGLVGPHRYGKLAAAAAQLDVEFEDGSRVTVITDESWRGSEGPILQSDMLMGETYDARKELTGWDKAGYSDSSWRQVGVGNPGPSGSRARLVAACDEPVREVIELTTRTITEPVPGHYIFDLGQNMVGWARLKVKGKAGDTVTMRFVEMLNPDGTIYTTNLRGAKQTDRYTLKGGGEEIYEPKFTFHGFRYVEVTGYSGKPSSDAITGIVTQSDTPVSGAFECSDPRINQLQRNIVWGQRGNFLSVPTDCPQRDERLGWTGDAQIFIRTATFNMDVSRFFTKWCRDLVEAQRDGAFTDVAPGVAAGQGTAAWGDAGVICPWTIYRVYGDTRILHEHYDAGVKWIDYLLKHSKDLLRPAEGYGDWISIGADTPKDVLATAYFAESTRIMASWAAVIGKTEDAEKYRELLDRIKAAFNTAYVSADAKIKGQTQTCYVLALAFDLLPEEKREAAAKHLLADIAAKGDHLSTGFVGVGHLLPTLTRAGFTDIAYKLLMQDTFPGWLYSVKNGATTIWERWDGWTKEKGFQDPGMNSFNHYSLGSVGEWMYGNVLGIEMDPHAPAFKKSVIHPRVGGGLTWSKGHYDSMYGRIASSWKQDGGSFQLDVTIPANTTATVVLPAGKSTVESGKKLEEASGVRIVRQNDREQYLEVQPGKYSFTVK